MKITKTAPIILITAIMLAMPLAGCSSGPAETEAAETRLFTVQRGNLVVDITAAGNLALSRTEDLTFEIAGTVEEVLVEEGDSVTEGQVLVRLDASEWEDELTTLKQQLTTAERQLTAAERLLETKQRTVLTRELALSQEEIDLQTAEYNLGTITDVQSAQNAVDDAEYDLRIAQAMWEEAVNSEAPALEINYWQEQINGVWNLGVLVTPGAKQRLATAQQDLADVLAENSLSVTPEVALQIASRQLLVDQARLALEDAQIAIDNALKDVDDARLDVEDARQDVEDAQESLDEALISSTEIIAAFDGFITTVNIEGGDEVTKGTVAVVIADPTKFEADILVNEMDIMQVETGGEASVQVDAMSGLTLPATVTHISPTATIQSGVVNYEVKVEVQPLDPAMQGQEQLMQSASQLRQGLTVTISVRIAQRADVLLVPNNAIIYRGGQSYIQLSSDGVIEERAITTGISDWQYTEVTDGLDEDDQVVVPQGTATSATQQGQQGGMFIMGGGPR